MGDRALTEGIAASLASGDHRGAGFTLEPCAAGGNNRVFVVTTGARQLIAKWYFSHPADTRDRLRTEYAFLAYAERLGLACVPRPVSFDATAHLALYEFVDGRKLGATEVSEHEVDAAIDFFLALNGRDRMELAAELPAGSEACFSLDEHFRMVDGRIARLVGIAPESDVDREAQRFVIGMRERWETLKAAVAAEALALGVGPAAMLAPGERCVSPSDFGFHNALVTPAGRVVFIDFEYAGWDDPAKLANDFFCQPAVEVDPRFYDRFVDRAMGFSPQRNLLAARARLMRPIFQAKWCCILLNDFVPVAAQRRRFADPAFDAGARKATQLARARARFAAIRI